MNQENIYQFPSQKSPEKKLKIVDPRRFGAAILVFIGLVGGTLYGIKDRFESAHFSDKTIEHVVEPGEGLDDAVYEIEGVGTDVNPLEAREYVKDMDQNKDVLADGLQPGEIVTIPESGE